MERGPFDARDIFDQSPDAVCACERDGSLVYVNPTVLRIFGRSREELIGRNVCSVFREGTSTAFKDALGRVVETGRAEHAEQFHEPPGLWFAHHLCLTAETVWVVSRDITEQRASSERELRHAVAIRDEFLSIASHELRTPLTTLGLQLDGLERVLDASADLDRDKLLRKVKSAIRQTDRLASLVAELLDVSRMNSGRVPLEREEFDVVDLVREISERFEEAARGGSSISIDAAVGARGSWDRGRLDQAFFNVIENAIKYGAAKPVRVTIDIVGDRVDVAVRDGGIGIAASDLERIFGRFERAASSAHYGGLGLGLYIAREIITAHQGVIFAESEPGNGATFTIRLPLRTVEGSEGSA